ncbi:hypothetical protein [Caballeronia sp. J97]|uniref:hypothetical protein n=1 Tax=Caballeronia sp. J97 TaxID=2805429 RepID=UPI002AB036AE|nr:hypothetical protein [Caballeronia sp. J97]
MTVDSAYPLLEASVSVIDCPATFFALVPGVSDPASPPQALINTPEESANTSPLILLISLSVYRDHAIGHMAEGNIFSARDQTESCITECFRKLQPFRMRTSIINFPNCRAAKRTATGECRTAAEIANRVFSGVVDERGQKYR